MSDTVKEYTVRDNNGDDGNMYGWWEEDIARAILARRRENRADLGPYKLICRTWTCVVEEIPDD
jgi:hypothetical protein